MKKLLLVLLILSSTTLWAEKYALMVGVNDVQGANALYTDIDLQIMSKLLKKAGFKITTLKRKNASLEKVRAEFRKFYKLTSNDIFLFYYTGHGARMKGINPNEPIDNFFVMNDANFTNGDTIGGGVLTDNEYSMHLHKIKAQKVSIVDACHSATIYKDLSSKKFIKSIHPKGANNIFNRANSVPNFQSFKPSNLINISATKDSQQAENSPIGSIFTVALDNLIRKNPNISFRTLETKLRKKIKPTALSIALKIKNKYPAYAGLEGKFTPVIKTAPLSLKSMLVKDIFVKPKIKLPVKLDSKPSLARVLTENPKHQLTIKTSDGEKSYPLNEPIKLYIFSKVKEGYLYVFEEKRDSFTFLDEQDLEDCQTVENRKFCKIDNIWASKPFGKSVIYAVITKQPLEIEGKHINKGHLKINKIDGVSLVLKVTEK